MCDSVAATVLTGPEGLGGCPLSAKHATECHSGQGQFCCSCKYRKDLRSKFRLSPNELLGARGLDTRTTVAVKESMY